jgi:hypothetical protein
MIIIPLLLRDVQQIFLPATCFACSTPAISPEASCEMRVANAAG